MTQAIGDILAPAVGVLLSPMPIVAVILMLFTPQAKTNGSAFAAGWVVGLLVTVGIVLALADPTGVSSSDSDDANIVGALLHVALGLGLGYLAYHQWQSRPRGDAEPDMPKWMKSIDWFSPLMAFGFGALMSSVNPKNLLMDIAAGSSIAQANVGAGGVVVAVLIYTIIASVAIVGVVVWALMSGKGAEARLNEMKTWLVSHNTVVMVVLLGILGVSQVGKGIGML